MTPMVTRVNTAKALGLTIPPTARTQTPLEDGIGTSERHYVEYPFNP